MSDTDDTKTVTKEDMLDAEDKSDAAGKLNLTFEELGLNEWLVKQLNVLGLKQPTIIQKVCIPEILKGRDCIGCAKTGSGKTAAFALPMLQVLCEDPYGIFALILTPTRELAFQIAEQLNVLGKPIGLKLVVITGGRDMLQQGLELTQRPHIVVSTPGRLADHIDSGTDFTLKNLRFLVLDEADRLLEDNFGAQLQSIFSKLPAKRQTLLFSATMTDTLRDLQTQALKTPFIWTSRAAVATVSTLDQRYCLVPADVKDAYLVHIIEQFQTQHEKSLIIIFTHTCKYCQILAMVLNEVGMNCLALHSMIPQRQRLAALAKFKSHQTRVLVATDVASRGLDIPAVDLVLNHNVPNRPKDYVHRVGRTARAGRGGSAITMVTQFDVKLFHATEEHINTKLKEYTVNEKEITKIVTEVSVAKREAEIKLDEQDFGEQKVINKRKRLILEGKNPDSDEKHRKRQKGKRKKQSS